MSSAARRATRAHPAEPPASLAAWLWAVGQVAVIAVECFLLLVLLALPGLRPTDIRLAGAQHLSAEDVAGALALPPGRSIFLLNHRSLEARLQRLAWVRQAEVSLSLPNRVGVRVREWTPVAVFQQGDRAYYLGERGVILGAAAEAGVLPVIERPGARTVREGAALLAPELLTLLTQMSQGFPGAFKLRISAMTLDDQQSLTVKTDRGFPILFGEMATADQRATLEAKLAALQALSTKVDLVHTPIAYINVMNPRQPTYLPRGR